jgi:hypothetical protein
MNTNKVTAAHEQVVRVQNGWAMLILLIAAVWADIGLMGFSIKDGVETTGQPHVGLLVLSIFTLPFLIILLTGFFTLQPNQARVLVLFGAYKGTVRTPGFHWGNPFYSRGPQERQQFSGADCRSQRHCHCACVGAENAWHEQDLTTRAHAERRQAQGE